MKEPLTEEESTFLMTYMLNGFYEKEFKILDLSFVIRTLTVDQQMEAQDMMKEYKGTNLQWAQKLRLLLLSFGLERFDKKEFKKQEESIDYLNKAPDLLVNKFTEAQAYLQEQLKGLLDRADDFTESPSSESDLASSSMETSSLK